MNHPLHDCLQIVYSFIGLNPLSLCNVLLCFLSQSFFKVYLGEFPLWLNRLRTQFCICEDACLIPGTLSGLRIQHCYKLWHVGHICGSDPVFHDCGVGPTCSSNLTPKKKKKKKKLNSFYSPRYLFLKISLFVKCLGYSSLFKKIILEFLLLRYNFPYHKIH